MLKATEVVLSPAIGIPKRCGRRARMWLFGSGTFFSYEVQFLHFFLLFPVTSNERLI